MAVIQFYGKPGCAGNMRQQRLLKKAGHHLVVHDLLSESWSPGKLRRFFGLEPVAEWFNRNAPAVKSGELAPEQLNSQQALRLMLRDPGLIRRPLMQANGRTWVGFDLYKLDGLLSMLPSDDLEDCPKAALTCGTLVSPAGCVVVDKINT